MSKHTPGPWRNVPVDILDGELRYKNPADVPLVLAAPDLLEACVAAIEATGGSHLWNGWTRRFLVLAENALRKAGVDPATIEVKQTIGPEDSSVESV